ncbi:DUF1653 domain-containing protein [Asaia spathodeae]|uniref:DUF1653 domain-containing protein n=2 Tax=Asaia spathodeae TaxID=657016 RepID=A0ABX2P8K1_9PROT
MTDTAQTEATPQITREQLENDPNKIYRHTKHGTLYKVHALGFLQIAGAHDMTECVIYTCLTLDKYWVRPVSEFIDGRFEQVTA